MFALSCLLGPANAQSPVSSPEAGKLPFRQQPIDYFGEQTDNAVAGLQARIDDGRVQLEYDERQGYLPAVLRALEISTDSQMLVFARNSVHARLISPRNPRALYFNDEVYVGWVPGAPVLEISAVDPQKGAIFYTLRQMPQTAPKFERQESCLLCHASVNAGGVPGHLARSFFTDMEGNPTRGISRITDATPVSERWGGWYVTGDLGMQPHRGNLASATDLLEHERTPLGVPRQARLVERVEISKYPGANSDIVALLVHDHQTSVHNLLTRAGFEERLRRMAPHDSSGTEPGEAADGAPGETEVLSDTETQLLRALLFADGPVFEAPILGKSGFEGRFARIGGEVKGVPTLRQFELETRLFHYRISYLVHSRAFSGLPQGVNRRLVQHLTRALSENGAWPGRHLPPQGELADTLQILRNSQPHWRESEPQN